MNKKKIVISGTGCALADYLYTNVRFDNSGFQKYMSRKQGDGGLVPGKLVFTGELESFTGKLYPEILTELAGDHEPEAFNIGGPGLVSMIHASQLLEGNDFEVRFYGGLGDDRLAGRMIDMVGKTPLGITNLRKISQRPTPFTHVLSDHTFNNGHGERTFINNIGAAWDFTPEMLADDFFEAEIVCFGGTALVPQLHDQLTDLLINAKKEKCISVVNTVFDFRNEKLNPESPWPLGNTLESLKLIDLLIMDREEAIRISGSPSIEGAAAYFEEQDISSFFITNGPNELYAYSNGSIFKSCPLIKMPVSNMVAKEKLKNPLLKSDTTGCGDNFAGGAVASLGWQIRDRAVGDLDLLETVEWAIASGGFACLYMGGTYFETEPNEKLAMVNSIKSSYHKQRQRG